MSTPEPKDPKKPIRGKVARIINTRELAMNVGAEQGVKVGMKFDVMDPKGQDIEDPDDPGKILGSLDRSKKRVEVVEVKEKVSLARTRSYRVNVGGGLGGIVGRDLQAWSQMMLPENWVIRSETLRATDEEGREIEEEESYVKVGDPVVEVLEDAKTPTAQPAGTKQP